MRMTLDEMKLAVCEKLPELIVCQRCPQRDRNDPIATTKWLEYNDWDGHHEQREINWPTEGLQVCHCAEKLLRSSDYQLFLHYGRTLEPLVDNGGDVIAFAGIDATYEQRLEALTRVWFPEKWKD